MKYIVFLPLLFLLGSCMADETFETLTGSKDRDDVRVIDQAGPQYLDQAQDLMEQNEHRP